MKTLLKTLLISLALCTTAFAQEGIHTSTPQTIVDEAFVELKKITSLNSKKFLDFGCGSDLRLSKEALDEGMEVTAVEIDGDTSDLAQAEITKEGLALGFLPNTDGLKIDWFDFDIVMFAYGIKDPEVIVDTKMVILPNGKVKFFETKKPFDQLFYEKAQELKDTSYVVLLFTKSDARKRSNSLVTDPTFVCDAMGNLTPVGEAKLLEGSPFDMYMQVYRK